MQTRMTPRTRRAANWVRRGFARDGELRVRLRFAQTVRKAGFELARARAAQLPLSGTQNGAQRAARSVTPTIARIRVARGAHRTAGKACRAQGHGVRSTTPTTHTERALGFYDR